jgi:hypothetical protein
MYQVPEVIIPGTWVYQCTGTVSTNPGKMQFPGIVIRFPGIVSPILQIQGIFPGFVNHIITFNLREFENTTSSQKQLSKFTTLKTSL